MLTTIQQPNAVAAPPVSPEPLIQMIQGLQVTATLQAAVQLGVFDRIAEGTDTVASIASAVEANERGTRILLDALAALRLLERGNGTYTLTPLSDAFLVSNRSTYLGGMLDLLAAGPSWASYPRLADAVRAGRTILAEHTDTPGFKYWETFAMSSPVIAVPAARALAEILQPWAAAHDHLAVLDIACGSGLYSLTLGARHPSTRTTLLDWPNVLEQARQNVVAMGLVERTSYLPGDVFQVPLGGPYDLIVASHIFHQFSEERCVALLRRLFNALRPGGRVAINDFMPASPRPADEPFALSFSIISLAWSPEGEAYPLDTYRRMVAEAGLVGVEIHPSAGVPSTFLIAERPTDTVRGHQS
jgi:cyclopropane fatty-acyl-phospholipid synthase-like methyltransferase